MFEDCMDGSVEWWCQYCVGERRRYFFLICERFCCGCVVCSWWRELLFVRDNYL